MLGKNSQDNQKINKFMATKNQKTTIKKNHLSKSTKRTKAD